AQELSQLSKEKNELVATISHEIRNPLAVVNDGINLILEGVEGPLRKEQRRTLDVVRRNVERLSRLVTNVLDFQEMNAGMGRIHFGMHSLQQVVGDVIETLDHEARSRGRSLSVEMPARNIIARCDADRIHQVLFNLIDNAMKFTNVGGRIAVRLRKE